MSNLKAFIKRNMPILLIGFVTLLIFIGIIIAGENQNDPSETSLSVVEQEELIADHNYFKGPTDAPVVLVEFSDFECPACGAYAPFLKQLSEEYPEDLKLVYKHYPLVTIHRNAKNAALAAQAAGEQDAFWEYHDLLFENQDALTEEDLFEYAVTLGLDRLQFADDYASEKIESYVEADTQVGNRLNIPGTPTFFLDGTQLAVQSPNELVRLVRIRIQQETGKEPTAATRRNTETRDLEDRMILENQGVTPMDEVLKEELGTITEPLFISYTEEGFQPNPREFVLGQKLIWQNNTENEIILEQKKELYDELLQPIPVAPGATFEFTPYKNELWNVREKNSGLSVLLIPYKLSEEESNQ